MGWTQVGGGGVVGHVRRGLTEFGGSLEEVLSEAAVADLQAFFSCNEKKKQQLAAIAAGGEEAECVLHVAMDRGDEFVASRRCAIALLAVLVQKYRY